MRKFFSAVCDWIVFILTGKGRIGKESVDLGICDFSSQGRDKYGN